MSEERETRLFMINPDSMVTPDQLVRLVHALGEGVTVKETCYGCLVEGPRATVRKVLALIRGKHPYDVYSKVRAYPCGDPRRCRAQHGTRPGFAQLEAEWSLLPMIANGLRAADAGKETVLPEKKKPIPVKDFKRICEESR